MTTGTQTMKLSRALADMMNKWSQVGHGTQQHTADQIGVSKMTVSRWLKGRSKPDTTYFSAIARYLNVTISDVLEMVQEEYGHGTS